MQTGNIRVLLVEDDEDDYVLIKDLLSEVPGKSFNLEWTHDYDAGIEAIESGIACPSATSTNISGSSVRAGWK